MIPPKTPSVWRLASVVMLACAGGLTFTLGLDLIAAGLGADFAFLRFGGRGPNLFFGSFSIVAGMLTLRAAKQRNRRLETEAQAAEREPLAAIRRAAFEGKA